MFSSIAFASTTNPKINMGTWHALMSASPMVQLTLLVLITLSIVSWAIIFKKRKLFKLKAQDNEDFINLFYKATSLDKVNATVDDYPNSSAAQVFSAAYKELQNLAVNDDEDDEKARPMISSFDNLERVFDKGLEGELAQSENRLSFLATTGSTGPFIGLFGTVWGIMTSFQKIGETGVAHLAVVAPGISEALIATAVGLLAAIPATVAYNHFLSEIRREELLLNSFKSDFLNIIKRNFCTKNN